MELRSMRMPLCLASQVYLGGIRRMVPIGIALLMMTSLVVADSKTYDVTQYGATPNDGKDDTAPIHKAINEANNAGGGTVYFPQGTYDIQTLALTRGRKATQSGAVRIDRPLRHIKLVGDGSAGKKATTLKRIQHPSARRKGRDQSKIAIVGGAQDLTIQHIAFDAHGVQRFGGISFHGCKGITIANTRFFDSDPFTYSPHYDRYAYVFGYGSGAHEDIVIRDNLIEDLQLEVDLAKRVQIVDNTVIRSDFTAAIGSFGLHSNGVFEDVVIAGNTIIDAAGQVIAIQLDFRPPKVVNNFRFRNIEIRDNRIVYTAKLRKSPGLVMRLGAADNSLATTGNTFENIRIENNHIYVHPDTPSFAAPLIFGNTSKTTGFNLENITVSHNTFYYNGKQRLIDIRRIPGEQTQIHKTGNQKLSYQSPSQFK